MIYHIFFRDRIGGAFPILSFFVLLYLPFQSMAQQHVQEGDTRPIIPFEQLSTTEMVTVKNYFLLSCFQQEEVKAFLLTDQSLRSLGKQKKAELTDALQHCGDVSCFIEAMQYREQDMQIVAVALRKLFKTSEVLPRLVQEQLKASGAYYAFNPLTAEEALIVAWKQDIQGVNYVIDVYGKGKPPFYPKIDSIAFDVSSKAFLNLLYDVTATVVDNFNVQDLFFETSLTSALRLLEINERLDAASQEPMTLGANKAAIFAISKINWDAFPYSLILVPGAGPEDPNVALSAESMLRCRVAAKRYQSGMAPFIVVSGAKVHPYKTKFIEAIEMKKYLIEVMEIPEKAILIEPHARHTTTNMRNCARMIYRYGIPSDKPAITSTNKYQSYYISNMAERCEKELGYVPYRLGERLSDTEQEFFPQVRALSINPMEPLDP